MKSTGEAASSTASAPIGTLVSMAFRSLGVLAVLAVPLASQGPVDRGPADRLVHAPTTEWKATYSEEYPGCVAAVLWPQDETPTAVVTLTPEGRVDRVALDAQHRPVEPLPDQARTIGACR